MTLPLLRRMHSLLSSLLSFFQNARRPGRNTRSLGLAFAINGMIYLGIGIVGYIGYHDYVAPDGTPGIRDNFLTVCARVRTNLHRRC